jgi:hypothetical protein
MALPLISTRARLIAPAAALLTGLVPGERAAVAQSDAAESPLRSLLSLVPAGAVGAETLQIAEFADIAAQATLFGTARPSGLDDDPDLVSAWLNLNGFLSVADPFRLAGAVISRDVFGLDFTDLDQTLVVGQPPETLTYLRGRFDPAELTRAWTEQGYSVSEQGGVTIASLAPDGEFTPDHAVQRIALNRMNNAALLADGTLVYAARLDLLLRAIVAADGGGPALAERVDIAELLGVATEPLASAIIVHGAVLQAAPMLEALIGGDPSVAGAIERMVETEPAMPPIALAMLGLTPGGPLLGRLTGDETPEPLPRELQALNLAYALMATPGTAAEAAAIALERLDTGMSVRTTQPYATYFTEWEAEALAEDNVLRLQLTPAGHPRIIWDMLLSRDMLFLAW